MFCLYLILIAEINLQKNTYLVEVDVVGTKSRIILNSKLGDVSKRIVVNRQSSRVGEESPEGVCNVDQGREDKLEGKCHEKDGPLEEALGHDWPVGGRVVAEGALREDVDVGQRLLTGCGWGEVGRAKVGGGVGLEGVEAGMGRDRADGGTGLGVFFVEGALDG